MAEQKPVTQGDFNQGSADQQQPARGYQSEADKRKQQQDQKTADYLGTPARDAVNGEPLPYVSDAEQERQRKQGAKAAGAPQQSGQPKQAQPHQQPQGQGQAQARPAAAPQGAQAQQPQQAAPQQTSVPQHNK